MIWNGQMDRLRESISISSKKHPILLPKSMLILGAYYDNLLKTHPLYVNWALLTDENLLVAKGRHIHIPCHVKKENTAGDSPV